MRFSVFTLLFSLLGLNFSFGQSSSVLSEGTWYKLGITQSGIYSLTYQDLLDMGINPQTVNPQNISLYGNGGSMLPQNNSVARPNDLVENAIWIEGGSDGYFDPNDKIYFYGQGPHIWTYDKVLEKYTHIYNLYSDTTYYFLRTDKPVPGKRISAFNSPTEQGQVLNTYDEHIFHEKDIINVNHSGRVWLGEIFDEEKYRVFPFDISGISDSVIHLNLAAAARSVKVGSSTKPFMEIGINGTTIDTIAFSIPKTLPENLYVPYTDYRSLEKSIPATGLNDELLLELTYDNGGPTAPAGSGFLYAGLLDYIEVQFSRNLTISTQKQFRSAKTLDGGTYSFKFPSNPELLIWEISDPLNPLSAEVKEFGDSSLVSFSGGASTEFAGFIPDFAFKPQSWTKIDNQNIHGYSSSPELIIFSSEELKYEAQRLANFHTTHDGIHSLVVTQEKVFNEFASGKRDVSAIRDLCRYFISKNGTLKYLLLFGMGSHDYKNIEGISHHHNFVPIYQSRESFDAIGSYASDDYFGFLEDEEGEWEENSNGNHSMDIGVGRMPVRTLEEARNYVDKIITYTSDPRSKGTWQSKVTLFADDGDFNLHLYDCESQARYISINYPEYSVNKLYLGRYHKSVFPGVKEYSQGLFEKTTETINTGTLLFNYVGHGVPRRLGYGIVDLDQVNTWKNKYRLPFFVTATCEFALADHPDEFSLGREIVLKKDAGGIGILSGTRPAYSSANKILVNSLQKYILRPDLRLGDIIKRAKNEGLSGVRNRHFIFLGDPALRLNVPEQKIRLTELNGMAPQLRDTLNALGTYTLKGEVIDQDSTLLSDYNGIATVTLFDKEKKVTTLGEIDDVTTFKERTDILFSGNTTVTNGVFEIEFVLPLEAADSIGSAKISMYASKDDLQSALGASFDFWTGEISPNAAEDFTPPFIELFMDSLTFASGDSVSQNPLLIAKLFDESGINQATASQENQIISIYNSDSTLVLNPYFETDTSDYRSGTVNYNFSNLPVGYYTLELSASDNYGNRGSESIDFIVYDSALGIFRPDLTRSLKAKAFPNPFNDRTSLVVSDIQGNVKASISIRDTRGLLIKEISDIRIQANEAIYWDGTDQSGNRVREGVYPCTISIPEKNLQHTMLLIVR